MYTHGLRLDADDEDDEAEDWACELSKCCLYSDMPEVVVSDEVVDEVVEAPFDPPFVEIFMLLSVVAGVVVVVSMSAAR
jgi:hypothetical protein